MQDNTINLLNALLDQNILHEDDKTQIIHMYNTITEYPYDSLFTNNTKFNILHYFNGQTDTEDLKIMMKDTDSLYTLQTLVTDNIYRGTIISDDKTTIFKTFIIDAEHVWKEQYCFTYLIELYFTLQINSILTDNDIISSPPLHRWGKVNINNRLIMYFFELPYYDTNTAVDNSNLTKNDIELITGTYINILNQNNLYTPAITHFLSDISNIINNEQIINMLHDRGIIVYNNKFYFIDHKHVFRTHAWAGLIYSLWTPRFKFNK